MADPQQKPKGPEVKVVTTPEVAPEVVPESHTTQRTGIALEVLEMRTQVDAKDLKIAIERINLQEDIEQQKGKLKALRGVLKGVFTILFNSEMTKEELQNLSILPPYVTVGGKKITFSELEKIAFQKSQEILKGQGALAELWQEVHPQMIEADYAQAQDVREAREAIADNTFSEKKGNPIIETIKKHPIISAGIAIAGAFGIYKFITGLLGGGKEEKEEGSSGWKGWKKWLIGGISAFAGVFLLGRILDVDKIQEFFKETFAIDLSNLRFPEFLRLAAQGKWKEAFAVLFEGVDKNKELHEVVVAKIKEETGETVNKKTLAKIGSLKYKSVVSVLGEARAMAADLFEIPFILSQEEEQEIAIVRAYLKRHEDEIGEDKEYLTVDEALARIVKIQASTSGTETALKHQDKAREQAIAGVDDPEKKAYLLRIEREVFVPLREVINAKIIRGYIAYGERKNIDTTRLRQLNAQKDVLEARYNNLIVTGASEEEIYAAAEELQIAYGEIAEEMAEVGKKADWEETLVDLSPQFVSLVRRFYLEAGGIPFGVYMVGKIAKAPLRVLSPKVSEAAVEKWRSPDLDAAAKKAALKAEMDALPARQDVSKLATEVEKIEATKHNAARDYLENEQKILAQEENLARARTGGKTRTIETAEKQLDALKRKRIELLEKRIDADWVDSKTRFFEGSDVGPTRNGVLKGEHYREMDRLHAEYERLEREIDELVLDKAKKLEALYAAGKKADDPVVKKLIEEINALNKAKIPALTATLGRMQSITMWWKTRWAAITGGSIEHAAQTVDRTVRLKEKAKMQEWMAKVLRRNGHVASAARDTGLRPVLKTAKGKLWFYLPMIAIGGYLNKDEVTDTKTALTQATVDVLPFSGTYSDWYSVFTGRELITQRNLGGTDRVIRGVFGTAGAVCDIASLVGVGLLGRGVLTGIRAGKGITTAVRAARATDKALEASKALKLLQPAKTFGRRLQFVGFAGALGAMGYSVLMEPQEVPIPPEVHEVLEDSLDEVTAQDVERSMQEIGASDTPQVQLPAAA